MLVMNVAIGNLLTRECVVEIRYESTPANYRFGFFGFDAGRLFVFATNSESSPAL